MKRWAEQHQSVLNYSSIISHAAIRCLIQVKINADLELPPIPEETINAVQQLSNGKASGCDATPAEIYKYGDQQHTFHLTTLLQGMCRQDFKDATSVHHYKRKGNRRLCDKQRRISLLNLACIIFAHVFLNRVNNHLKQGFIPKNQCASHRHRSTTDIIFVARQLQEKCQDMRSKLYNATVDLTKASGTGNRVGQWKLMHEFGYPEHFTHMVRQLHAEMVACITDNGIIPEAFAVTNEVKWGCGLAPSLFSLMFSAMLMNAYCEEHPGRSPSQHPTHTGTYDHSHAEFGLTTNTDKTVLMHQPPPGVDYNAPRVNFNGAELKNNRHGLQLSMKVKTIKPVILMTLLYGAENWTIYASQARNLNRFHLRCLCQILNLRWQDKIQDAEVLDSSGFHYFFDDHLHHENSTTRCPAALTRQHHALSCDPLTVPSTNHHGHHTPSNASPSAATLITTSTGGWSLICHHCNHTFTSCISLVDHLRIHRTETGN
ncbi:unnamed protein product [Dibothriocephalus latus]|uniref:C2H2-type domain-containing protein n=1 Tax=Dibothriocephalus latus TaxID=60516 RepID=A0A3P6QCM6_DIBLA|nr:unnamed protein product [Dibothriocephalus latus]